MTCSMGEEVRTYIHVHHFFNWWWHLDCLLAQRGRAICAIEVETRVVWALHQTHADRVKKLVAAEETAQVWPLVTQFLLCFFQVEKSLVCL